MVVASLDPGYFEDVYRRVVQGEQGSVTLVGADRRTSIDFWEGVMGMPFVFEQPNLDRESESHLYFDPGDGRLITIFTNEERKPDPERTSTDPGVIPPTVPVTASGGD